MVKVLWIPIFIGKGTKNTFHTDERRYPGRIREPTSSPLPATVFPRSILKTGFLLLLAYICRDLMDSVFIKEQLQDRPVQGKKLGNTTKCFVVHNLISQTNESFTIHY